MIKIPCPATYREMLQVLLAAQLELLDFLDIARGCGAPTPEAEKSVLDQIGQFARAAQIAAAMRGRDTVVEDRPISAAIDATEPADLFSALAEACRMLLSPSAPPVDGLSHDRIRAIIDAAKAAEAELDRAVGTVLGESALVV